MWRVRQGRRKSQYRVRDRGVPSVGNWGSILLGILLGPLRDMCKICLRTVLPPTTNLGHLWLPFHWWESFGAMSFPSLRAALCNLELWYKPWGWKCGDRLPRVWGTCFYRECVQCPLAEIRGELGWHMGHQKHLLQYESN